MKHIYIISGLGADERAFQKIDFSGIDHTFIQWIPPMKNESISNYANRLLAQIKIPSPILIGLSFGGMMSIEISKIIPIEKIILIASVKTRSEMPPWFRRDSAFDFSKYMPFSLFKKPGIINNWLFGVEGKTEKKLLGEILNDTDVDFLKWAIHEISGWKNEIIPGNLVHIHGTADRIFPFKYVVPDKSVKAGGHFMTINKSAELSRLLRKELIA